MSANAREAPPRSVVDAPVVVLGAQQPVLQVGAVDQPDRARSARCARARAPRGRWGSSGRRTARRRPAGRGRGVDDRLGAVARPSRSASRRSRACRRPARPRRAARADGWACRCGRRRRRRPRPAPRRCRTRARLPAPPRRARARSGDEAATPTREAPASRAERACTAPMNPVPAMATRTPRDMRTNLVALHPTVKQKVASIRRVTQQSRCYRRHFSRFEPRSLVNSRSC